MKSVLKKFFQNLPLLGLLLSIAPAQAENDPPEPARSESALVITPTLAGHVPIKSWKTMRDARVVKQNQDFSCGAASLATILNEQYSQTVTEEEILKAMGKEHEQASFDAMASIMPQFGFKAQGFAASWEQLTQLHIPVLVYLKNRKDDHFSVLRGISDNTVWLADPSLGNRTFSREQFLSMWETRNDDMEHAHLRGKFLAILPIQPDIQASDDFFTKTPLRQTILAIEQLSIRPMP
ncbi:MAG: cysteine peptidase family C39 domain-containing protein [Betaproteobacteria bacterium]|nr:cysteine peptidase family C39 domain-containing protein [Betaproteobacteria bacterium]